MTRITRYVAEDGREFSSCVDCRLYEEEQKKIFSEEVRSEVSKLDISLWEKYMDVRENVEPARGLEAIWLRNDIVLILCKNALRLSEVMDEIVAVIKKANHGEYILNKYICVEELLEEALVRTDYDTAFGKYDVSRISSIVRYAFGKDDIRQLAELHKKKKYRKKIENLLTNCNFHYECSSFMHGAYDKFILVT